GEEPVPAEGTRPVPGALESLISWVQTEQPSAAAVAEERPAEPPEAAHVVAEPEPVGVALSDYEPEPIVLEPTPVVVEPVVVEPVGVELVDAQPAVVEPLGIEPVVEPDPRPEVGSALVESSEREGVPALREAAWLIERYIAILEKRPIGADLHLAAARLARSGDAIAGLKALADALDADVHGDDGEPHVEEDESEPPYVPVADVASPDGPEHDVLGTAGRIRGLSHDPPLD